MHHHVLCDKAGMSGFVFLVIHHFSPIIINIVHLLSIFQVQIKMIMCLLAM